MIRWPVSARATLAVVGIVVAAVVGLTVDAPGLVGVVNLLILLGAAVAIVGACLGARPTRAFSLGFVAFLGVQSLSGGPLHPLVAWLAPSGERPPLLTETLVAKLCEWKSVCAIGVAVEAIDPSVPVNLTFQPNMWYDGSLAAPSGGTPAVNSYPVLDFSGDSFVVPSPGSGGAVNPYVYTSGTITTYPYPSYTTSVYSPGRISQATADQYEITWTDGRTTWVPAVNVRRQLGDYREQVRSVLMLLTALVGGALSLMIFGQPTNDPAPSMANADQV